MTTYTIVYLAFILAFIVFAVWINRPRQWNGKARLKRRLLVQEGDQIVWRTVRARYLVGHPDSKGMFRVGLSVYNQANKNSEWWAVLEAKQGTLIAYCSSATEGDYRLGTLRVCHDWEELKQAVPAEVFDEAAKAAGRLKPVEYRELPLEL